MTQAWNPGLNSWQLAGFSLCSIICDLLSKKLAHRAFYEIEIRPEIGIPMCNCAAGKKWK